MSNSMISLVFIISIYIVVATGAAQASIDENDGFWWKLLVLIITIISLPTMTLLTIGYKLGKWIYKED